MNRQRQPKAGAPQSITGSLVLNHRFPGQWFQLESGLHDNWHRHYDPSLGRYTQPDPLGFVDGPSVFAYVRGNPQAFVDLDGRNQTIIRGASVGGRIGGSIGGPGGAAVGMGIGAGIGIGITIYQCYREKTPKEDCTDLYVKCYEERWYDEPDWDPSMRCESCMRMCQAQGSWPYDRCPAKR
ncbi:MAG: RHS repeat-associated core domain-containing protein [Pseudomonadota bacterium]